MSLLRYRQPEIASFVVCQSEVEPHFRIRSQSERPLVLGDRLCIQIFSRKSSRNICPDLKNAGILFKQQPVIANRCLKAPRLLRVDRPLHDCLR